MDCGFSMLLVYENDEEDFMDLVGNMDLPKKHYIFIPINDNQDRQQKQGGGHWALTLVDVKSKSFYYYDSAGSIIQNAKLLFRKLTKLVFKDTKNFKFLQ